MEYTMPHRISGEKDLKHYEQYLEAETKLLRSTEQTAIACKSAEKADNCAKSRTDCQDMRSINCRTNEIVENKLYFQGYLNKHIGKLVKVESLLGENLESRTGILMSVGLDYITLKLNRNCCSMAIQSRDIKYITIMHSIGSFSK